MNDHVREKRAFPRVDIDVFVKIKFESFQHFIEEYAENISVGGIFVRTQDPCSIGTKIHLEFSLVLEEIKIIDCECEVAHIIGPEKGERAGMGLRFVNLSEENQRMIEAIVEKRRTATKDHLDA